MTTTGAREKKLKRAEKVEKLRKEKKELAEKNNEVKELSEALSEALAEQYQDMSGIKREGTQIVIPEHMTLGEAAEAISNWEQQMEEPSEQAFNLIGHPDDLAVCFYEGFQKAFGQVVGKSRIVYSFFGKRLLAAQSVTATIDYEKTVSVPVGNLVVPGLPVKIETKIVTLAPKHRSKLTVLFSYKNKYEPLVTHIMECVREEYRNHSIFRHKAFDSTYKFINTENPVVNKIVHSNQEERDLETHIFSTIRRTSEVERRGMSIKRTVLLTGRFGTGKTLTALKAAQICKENEWTFLNVKPGDPIVEALECARKYTPCLVFFEDIDQEAPSGKRAKINNVLNTVDGILSKSARVMTILTTNDLEGIEKAMLRPGRIDAVIEMGKVDEGSFEKLVRIYCGDALSPNTEVKDLFHDARDYTPSFIAEACNRALLYSMSRNGHEEMQIEKVDIEDALKGIRAQYEMMMAPSRKIKGDTIGSEIEEIIRERTSDLEQKMSEIHDTVSNIYENI